VPLNYLGQRLEFDTAIKEKLGDSFSRPEASKQSKLHNPMADDSNPQYDGDTFDPYFGVEEESQKSFPEADCVDTTGKPLLQQLMTDTLIKSEVLLPHGDDLQIAIVLGHTLDRQGRVIGNPNDNPLINKLMCDVKFPDGNIKKYAANIIDENVLENCDSEGH